MAPFKAFLGFIFRSIFLGLIVAALILLFIPDLRIGAGFDDPWFSRDRSSAEKISYYDALAISAPAAFAVQPYILYSHRYIVFAAVFSANMHLELTI